jgi:ABC-type transport system substrate-binding protein
MKKVLFIMIVLLLVTACATTQPAPTSTSLPPTDTSVPPTQVPQPIEVTYDGKGCTVTGPTELPMGEHQFIFRDLTEKNADLYVEYFSEGKTFQDYLDLQSKPGEYVNYQPWAQQAIKRGTEWNESIDGKVYTYLLNEEAEHIILIGENWSRNVWFCAPLWVIEAPSE